MRISDWSSDVCSSDLAALEQPVLVISVIGEAADRALGARRAVAVVERAVAVLPAPDRIGVVFGQVRRGLERVLAPGGGRVRAQELRGQPGVAVPRFPLRGGSATGRATRRERGGKH